uniref:Large ribosomal subunit protein uL11m n=1 Tax=Strigamia maritima TaxID=126957 RepID=T1JKG6_STRMM
MAAKAVRTAMGSKFRKPENVWPGNRIKTDIPAGKAAASPPLGTMLGQPDRSYELTIHQPPSTYFLKQAAGCQTAATHQGEEVAGKITLKHIYEIAKIKHKDPPLEIRSLKAVCYLLIGTAQSCGIKVVKDLNADEYAQFLEERKEFLAKRAKELEELKQAKLERLAA